MYEIYLIRPDKAHTAGGAEQSSAELRTLVTTGNAAKDTAPDDVADVEFFRLYAGSIDFEEGQDIKTTIGPNHISFQFGLKKEKPRICAIGNIYVGNTNSSETKNFISALSYAKTEWSKKSYKLAALYIYDTESAAEDQTFYQWNGTAFGRFKGAIRDFKKKIDLNMNVFIPQLSLEGAWG